MDAKERRRKALVVDDSAVDRKLASRLLEKGTPWEICTAVDGQDAIAKLENQNVDIVITDMAMPNMDGLALVEEIGRRFPSVPVILMTAHGSEEIASKALSRGAASYVPKRKLAAELVSTAINVLEIALAKHQRQQVYTWMTHAEWRFVIGNDLSTLSPLVGFIENVMLEMKICDEMGLIRIGVALREALSNAICHGNLEVESDLRDQFSNEYFELVASRAHEMPYAEREVQITTRVSQGQATIVICDEGPGFDPSSLPDPTDPSNLEKSHGRGLLLIRTFMDEVFHNEKGNQITMIKKSDLGAEPK
jgi:CheY-like chemotaxis protein